MFLDELNTRSLSNLRKFVHEVFFFQCSYRKMYTEFRGKKLIANIRRSLSVTVGSKPLEIILWVKSETGPCTSLYQKEAAHFRLVGGRFNKPGNYIQGLSWGAARWQTCLPLPSRTLKVCTEALMGFSPVFSPDGLSNTFLSQSCSLENSSHCGNGGQSVHSKGRGRAGRLRMPGASSPTSSQILSVTSFHSNRSRNLFIQLSFLVT